jgi:hypothetical protein
MTDIAGSSHSWEESDYLVMKAIPSLGLTTDYLRSSDYHLLLCCTINYVIRGTPLTTRHLACE